MDLSYELISYKLWKERFLNGFAYSRTMNNEDQKNAS